MILKNGLKKMRYSVRINVRSVSSFIRKDSSMMCVIVLPNDPKGTDD